MTDDELALLADPSRDQHFLTNPAKLQFVLDAANIRSTDHVVELGAGAGTVARALPVCESLTLVELDERLVPALQNNAPKYASVINADGVELLRKGELHADVILGNLPNLVTNRLVALLPQIFFRVGVFAAGSTTPFEKINHYVQYRVLTEIRGHDFTPAQSGSSILIAATPRVATGQAY